MKAVNILSILAYLILVAVIVILFIEHALFAEGIIPICVQVLAALLMIWARITFGGRSFHAGANPTAGGLVTSGPYKFVRHPIYASIFYFVWAGTLTHFSLASAALAIVATATLLARIFSEERLVVTQYPEYAGYAARTKRIVPFVW